MGNNTCVINEKTSGNIPVKDTGISKHSLRVNPTQLIMVEPGAKLKGRLGLVPKTDPGCHAVALVCHFCWLKKIPPFLCPFQEGVL